MTAGGNGNLNLWRYESADKSNKVGLLYVMNNERIRWRRNRKKTSFMKRSKVRKRRFPFSMCLSHRSSSWGLQAYPTSQYVNSRGIRIKLAWASPPPSIKSPESSLWHAWRNPNREQRGFWRYLTRVFLECPSGAKLSPRSTWYFWCHIVLFLWICSLLITFFCFLLFQ